MTTVTRAVATARAPDSGLEYAEGLMRRIVSACPARRPGSADERRAQEMLAAELEARGAAVELAPFRFSTNLYAVLALHFGLATLASALWFFQPALSFVLHALVAISYTLDSSRRVYLLRRLLGARPSQNLIATLPAQQAVRRRIVILAHADAALTGWLFRPSVIRSSTNGRYPRGLGFLRRSLLVATVSTALLALLGALAWLDLFTAPALVVVLLAVPALLAFVINLQIVLRDEVVPGANDNLSACVALPALLDHLAPVRADDVELVFVATGCEEAGTGGAFALAQQRAAAWPRESTVVVAIDGLSNGELRQFTEGEVLRFPVRPWLADLVEAVATASTSCPQVRRFEIPAGASDAAPFLARGYDAVALGCVDPDIGAPRHYHQPSDTPDNLDWEQLGRSIDFVEKLVLALQRPVAPVVERR